MKYKVALSKSFVGWFWTVFDAETGCFVAKGWSWSYKNAIKNADRYGKII